MAVVLAFMQVQGAVTDVYAVPWPASFINAIRYVDAVDVCLCVCSMHPATAYQYSRQ